MLIKNAFLLFEMRFLFDRKVYDSKLFFLRLDAVTL